MQLDSLELLATKLAATDQCRFIAPDTQLSSPFHHVKASLDGRSVSDVFRQIEKTGSWIALYNVQTDPVYQAFLWDVMASAANTVSHEETVWDVRGFIFISAPPSVTPFHIDRENNFWMQIRGRKTLTLWDNRDRLVVPAEEVENFIVYRSLDKVQLKDEFISRATDFDCGPGDGVYFPSTTPHMTRTNTHWVAPENGVSVSIGIDFYTDRTRRAAYVHTINRMMRQYLGLRPRSPGESALSDAMKYQLGRLAVAVRCRFRGYTPPPGF